MLSFSLIRTFIPLCIGVCLGASATVANAYSVSVSAPGSITYSAIQTSASNQTTYIHGTQFSVTDTRGATVGYYATISSSNLTSGSKTIGRENLALYVTGATVSTLSGSANASVVVPTGAGAIGSQYVSLSSATTLISRTNAGGGLYGTYGVSPAFRLTIPAYTPSGSYSATLTITLIENE
ncbi:MAG TPA: hypothetical protein PK765_04395 [bacterium]|nr:hypothetical protein [bacterium]